MEILYHFRVKGVGPERVHISGISGAFMKLGHDVTFVSPTNVNPLKAGDIAPSSSLLKNFIYYVSDKSPQFVFELLEIAYNFVAFYKLVKQIRKKKPDFIYERYAFYCISGVLVAKIFNIPLFLEVNEIAGHERVRSQSFVNVCKIFEKFCFGAADKILVVSDFLQDEICQKGIEQKKVEVIPNGIDPDDFKVTDNNVLNNISGKLVIGFVGYLVHWHRLDDLLNVFAKICKEFDDIVLVLVGDGVLRQKLEGLATQLSIRDKLVITGRVNHCEVPNFISAFDVALIPNSNDYRSPIKMFEYMAIGKPVIAPELPPIVKVMQNEECGFLFENGNFISLENSLRSALSQRAKLKVYGEKGRSIVFEKYTWRNHASRILQLFKQMGSR